MQLTEQELLEELRRLANGRIPPTHDDMESKGDYSPDSYVSRWGSWNTAVRKAGYIPRRGATETELLTEIHRLSNGDSPPTAREMANNGRWSIPTYIDRFGSWNEAIQRAEYSPHVEIDIPEDQLLKALEDAATDASGNAIFEESKHQRMTYARHFHSYWTALVKAGIPPSRRRPLSPIAISKFHEAAVDEMNTSHRLLSLLFQFTGLTLWLIDEFDESWIVNLGDTTAIKVPAKHLKTEEPWSFTIPNTWIDPATGEEKKTTLPSLLEWYFDHFDSSRLTRISSKFALDSVAKQASLSSHREIEKSEMTGVQSPRVRQNDLRATLGIQMARNGAPTHVIEDHLGVKETGWKADVHEFFVWLDEHEDSFSHPDYDPP